MSARSDQDVLRGVVTEVVADQIDAARAEAVSHSGFSPSLWSSVDEGGFTEVAVPEAAGGPGGSLADMAAVLRVSGYYAAPVPLAEHNVAALVLAEAGRQAPAGPLTIVAGSGGQSCQVTQDEGGWRATGTLRAVPWAGPAGAVVVLAEGGGEHLLGVVSTDSVTVTVDPNIAGEPSADVMLQSDGVELVPVAAGPDRAAALLTLAWTLLITGSLRRTLALTVQYSREREQFGRPIAAFQAVGQQLAALAGATEQAEAIVDLAVATLLAGEDATEVVLAAKICTGDAARTAIDVGHQVHGAIGVTEEHELHHHTRRLMAWRDQGGSEARASLELGRRIADAGADRLWGMLTAAPVMVP